MLSNKNKETIGILSRGIQKIEHLVAFLPDYHVVSLRQKINHKIDAVAGWGIKATSDKARQYAKSRGIPYIALEDGFLRSIQLGRDKAQPLSLVVDPIGIYYDARKPSLLEQWIQEGTWTDPPFLKRASNVRARIREERLSKYNHAYEKKLWPDNSGDRILVIDQTFGDMSVEGARADKASFHDMLQAAMDENPHAEIVIKTHPDVLAGHRSGYLDTIPDDSRISFLVEDIHPWSILDSVTKVYTVSSLLGFEALLSNKPVRCFGMPFYAGWGLTEDELSCSRRTRRCTLDEVFAAAYLKYSRYVDPINGRPCEVERIITLLSDRRRHWLQTKKGVVCSGMSLWKRSFLPNFLGQSKKNVRFVKSHFKAEKNANRNNKIWAYWASDETTETCEHSKEDCVSVLRIEDAFLRSAGLGSDLSRPWSLALDDEGIYYDGSRPSRLETLLRETEFTDTLLQRTAALREAILLTGLTKYNVGTHTELNFDQGRKRLVLVPGQVEDDASVLRGSPEIRTNLELLRHARQACPEAFLIYKPHPDVLAGNRRGHIPEGEVQKLCDRTVTEVAIDRLLEVVDEVHTMTSLTGFEALLRGKQVSCYGLPFYAGWGLTEDRLRSPRRGRTLMLDQLVAAALILYPTYVDPKTGQICSVEDLLNWLARNKTDVQGPPWKIKLIRVFQNLRQGRP